MSVAQILPSYHMADSTPHAMAAAPRPLNATRRAAPPSAVVTAHRLAAVADRERLERVAQALACRIAGAQHAGTMRLFRALSETARGYFLELALEALRAAGLEA